MLQQTTTTAVIPFFERFVLRFPRLETLAKAAVEDVVDAWAGLGYYSRARNLHKSAQALYSRGGFPRTYAELLELPGFGPYTSRAVSSLAFDERVGVVDGNVIRVLSRFYAKSWSWWLTRERECIQTLADQWVEGVSPYQMNQALMELGRTVCTPKSPSCLLCPIRSSCQAHVKNRVEQFPLSRPRRERELWIWEALVEVRGEQIRIARNTNIPFLRKQWSLPGRARQVEARPKVFHYQHSITHHDIFVTVSRQVPKLELEESKWIPLKEIRRHVPASLVQKALAHLSDHPLHMVMHNSAPGEAPAVPPLDRSTPKRNGKRSRRRG